MFSSERMNTIHSDQEEEDDQPLSIEDLYALAIEMKQEGKLKMAKQSCLEGIQKLRNHMDTTSEKMMSSSSTTRHSSSCSLLFSFYNLISQICLELKEYEDALDYNQQVLDLDSLFMDARYRMGFILIQMKVFDLAKNVIEESMKLKLENEIEEQVMKKKFSSLLELIEKNGRDKKNHHSHHLHEKNHSHETTHHSHETKHSQSTHKILIHLIRTFSQNFLQSLISEYLMSQLSTTTTTQHCEQKSKTFLLLPKSLHNHETITSPHITFYQDVIMQCMTIYEMLHKSETNEKVHFMIVASPSLNIEEFRDHPFLNLVHSGVSLNASTFYNDIKSDDRIVQVIEESNLAILENSTTLCEDIKATIQTLNTNISILDSNQSILHDLMMHSSNTFDFQNAVDHLGWWKTLSHSSPRDHYCNIVSFVFCSRKPFNLQQLLQKLNNSNGEESELFWDVVIRSKGFIWVDSDHNYLYDWSTSGSQLKVVKKTLFLAAYPPETLSKVLPERLVEMKRINKWMEPFGDRRQEIAFICRKTSQVADPYQFISQFLSSMTKTPSNVNIIKYNM
ncbi:hypothetical protein C9374_013366 [Naegleria lovaniensis]|uniref:CobW C-terminal domain-containing protein n=1 Tax=Naegleria lovaniensis TaxID=51637 RepID=A0AA88KPV5_NAELO|nr:uncharacterized protein C9374_013366 [Naegleria lovaniensis]KAG2391881.1 hypothetical protein C9374_013366 [Naegleria lovaniensis]